MVLYKVAPRVGAWIETINFSSLPSFTYRSHPVWVRGLKHEAGVYGVVFEGVAPRVGAWIETLTGKRLM